jgi:hypothetical protein
MSDMEGDDMSEGWLNPRTPCPANVAAVHRIAAKSVAAEFEDASVGDPVAELDDPDEAEAGLTGLAAELDAPDEADAGPAGLAAELDGPVAALLGLEGEVDVTGGLAEVVGATGAVGVAARTAIENAVMLADAALSRAVITIFE